MKVVDDFLTGSYSRHTMIGPLKEADIDVFMVLDPYYFNFYNGQNGGPKALLDYTKRILLKTYTRTPDISRNGQAITIRFDDFIVDVVVAFNRRGGGYIMANALRNGWLETDPKMHVQIVTDANKRHNGSFVPLVKMIKGWNKSHGSYFRSFHLEVLALQILNGVTITNFPSGVRFFFDKARVLIRSKALDPAGYGDDVGSYISGPMVQEAALRMETAFKTCIYSEMAGNRGDSRGAVEGWNSLFKSYFPTYG
jgi:hypothetical protein